MLYQITSRLLCCEDGSELGRLMKTIPSIVMAILKGDCDLENLSINWLWHVVYRWFNDGCKNISMQYTFGIEKTVRTITIKTNEDLAKADRILHASQTGVRACLFRRSHLASSRIWETGLHRTAKKCQNGD